MRQIVSAVLYTLRSGCAWKMLPDSFPPLSTLYRGFARFRDDGAWGQPSSGHARARWSGGRPDGGDAGQPECENHRGGGLRDGYDAGKEVKDRKRDALVDTDATA